MEKPTSTVGRSRGSHDKEITETLDMCFWYSEFFNSIILLYKNRTTLLFSRIDVLVEH